MKTVVALGSIFVLAAATPVSHSAWRNGTIHSPAQKHVTRDLGINDPGLTTETIHTTKTIDTTWTVHGTWTAKAGTVTYPATTETFQATTRTYKAKTVTLDPVTFNSSTSDRFLTFDAETYSRDAFTATIDAETYTVDSETTTIDTTLTTNTTITIDTTRTFEVPITIPAASEPTHAADDWVDCILHPVDCVSSITSDLKATATPSPISRHVKKSATSESIPSITSEVFTRIGSSPTVTGTVTPEWSDISIIQGNMTVTINEASIVSFFDQLETQAASRIEEVADEAYYVWKDAVHSFLEEASISLDLPFTSLPQPTGVQQHVKKSVTIEGPTSSVSILPTPTTITIYGTALPLPTPSIVSLPPNWPLPNWPFTSLPQSTGVQVRDWLVSRKVHHRPDHKSESPSCSFTDSQCVDCSEDDDALICDQCDWVYECSDKKSCLYQDGHELVRHCQEKEVACRHKRSDQGDDRHSADDEPSNDDDENSNDDDASDDEESDEDSDEDSDDQDSDDEDSD